MKSHFSWRRSRPAKKKTKLNEIHGGKKSSQQSWSFGNRRNLLPVEVEAAVYPEVVVVVVAREVAHCPKTATSMATAAAATTASRIIASRRRSSTRRRWRIMVARWQRPRGRRRPEQGCSSNRQHRRERPGAWCRVSFWCAGLGHRLEDDLLGIRGNSRK